MNIILKLRKSQRGRSYLGTTDRWQSGRHSAFAMPSLRTQPKARSSNSDKTLTPWLASIICRRLIAGSESASALLYVQHEVCPLPCRDFGPIMRASDAADFVSGCSEALV